MAGEDFDQSRTEAPTQRRREEARQQGQVAVSSDLSSGVMLLAGVVVLAFGAKAFGAGLLADVRLDLLANFNQELDADTTQALFALLFRQGLELIGLLLGLLFVLGVGVGFMQVGFYLTPERMAFHWERLSPVEGWRRIFSLAGGVHGLIAIAKVTAIALLTWWVFRGRAWQIGTLGAGTLPAATAQAWAMMVHLALAVGGALALLGVVDYVFQWWRHEQALRMSRQELKEEIKREEGDPQIKGRIRKMQRELAKKRMFKEVPRATVVITNPTHLAIALRYERGSMPAPRVVAKGAGFVAERIVALARSHAVPVVERKPLAQALYKAVNVDQEIPAALFYAVAELLAYVYRLRGKV